MCDVQLIYTHNMYIYRQKERERETKKTRKRETEKERERQRETKYAREKVCIASARYMIFKYE